MKGTDGIILPGGIISTSNNDKVNNNKLIPLKVTHNKYKNKKNKEIKKEFLKPNKNETLKEFSRRVDIESRKRIIERDREMLRIHKSMKNKAKREKRANKNMNKIQIKNQYKNDNDSDSIITEKPLFGDVITKPPNISSKIKDKLDKSKNNEINKNCNDLNDYIEQVRKAYSKVKEKRLLEKNKHIQGNEKSREKILNNFGEGWIGIGKFRNNDI